MESLSEKQINENLEKLSNWHLEKDSIKKDLEFLDFKEAVEFINKIKEIAEAENHHPDIKLYNYNKLEIKLRTHSSMGLTKKDFDVALKIDSLRKPIK